MKKFPTVSAFEVNATDYSANFELLVVEMVKMRTEHNMTWVLICDLFKASKYNEYLSVQKLYQEATKRSKAIGKTAPKAETAPVAPKAGSVADREAKLQAQIAESKAKQVEVIATGHGQDAVDVNELPAHPEAAPAPITVEGFFGVEGEAAELLRKILLKDLASADSILLAEIQKKL